MAHRIAPRRLLLALRNSAAGITLIVAPVLLFLGVAGPGQAAQAATTTTPAAYYTLAIDGGLLCTFPQLGEMITQTPATPATVVLKGGTSCSRELWALHEAVLEGSPNAIENFILTINTGSPDGPVVGEWELSHAWVSALQISEAKAGGSSIVQENVTITAGSVQWVR